ncbi:MAG: hypothetical protein WC390_10115 [Sulfurimonas sp.]|jgi:outer membrane murein-binding lipoprotein Lpp
MRLCIFLPLILAGCASRSAQIFLMQAVEQQNQILLKLESQNQRLSLEIEQMKVAAAVEKGNAAEAQECVKSLFDTINEGTEIKILAERAKINMEQVRDKMRPWIIRLFDKQSPIKSPEVQKRNSVESINRENSQPISAVGIEFGSINVSSQFCIHISAEIMNQSDIIAGEISTDITYIVATNKTSTITTDVLALHLPTICDTS